MSPNPPPPLTAIALAIVLGAVTVGCSGDAADATDTDTARVVCDGLRNVDNTIVDEVNASVAGIAGLPAEARLQPILEGADEISGALSAWDVRIDGLELASPDEADELRRQLHGGVVDAQAELTDQRVEFEAQQGPVPDDEVQGVVGIWFNTVEKVVSSLEPEIFRFDRRDFKQAFLDEPACRNVVQQFVND